MVAPLEDVRRLFVEPKTQNGTGRLEAWNLLMGCKAGLMLAWRSVRSIK